MADNEKDLNIFLRLKDEFTQGIKNANDALGTLNKQADIVSKSTKNLQDAFNSMALKGGLAFGALSLAIGGFIAEAKEAEQVDNKLRTALSNQGLEVEKNIKQLDELAQSLMRKSVFDKEEIKGIETKLVTYGLHDQALAKLTQGMVDYATFSGKDVQGASLRVGLAIEGATDKVKGLDINLKGVVGTQQRAAIITEALSKKFKGQAEAATDGLGALDVLKNSSKELGEEIGNKLAPTIILITKWIQGLVDFLNAHPVFATITANVLLFSAALTGLVFIIGTIGSAFITTVAAIGTIIKTIEALNIVTAIMNALLAVNPIVWIVVACIAAVAAIALLILNWQKVVAAFKAGYDWIKNNFVGIATIIFKAFTNPIGLIMEHWDELVKWFKGIAANIGGFFKNMFSGKKAAPTAGGNTGGGADESGPAASVQNTVATTTMQTSGFSTDAILAYQQAVQTTADESLSAFEKIGQSFTDNVVNGIVNGTLDMGAVWTQFTMDLETQILENAFNPITAGMDELAMSITSIWNNTFGQLLSPITSFIGSMITMFGQMFAKFILQTLGFQTFFTTITALLATAWTAMSNNMVVQWLIGLVTMIMSFLATAGGMILGFALIAASAAAAAVALIPFIGPILAPIAYVATFAFIIGGLAQLAGIAVGLAYGTSEVVGGNSGDTVDAKLTPGEMVVPKSMAQGIKDGDLALSNNDNANSSSGSSGNTYNITVALDGAQFIGSWTRDMIVELGGMLGDAIRNKIIPPLPAA